MATLTCPVCRTPYQPGDVICLNCGTNLTRVRAAREDAGRARQPEPQQQPPQQPPQQQPQQQQPQPPQQQPQQYDPQPQYQTPPPRYDQPPQQYEQQPQPYQQQPPPQQYEPQPYQQQPYEPQPQQYDPQPYQPNQGQPNQGQPNQGQQSYEQGYQQPPQPYDQPPQYDQPPYAQQPQQPYQPYEPQQPQYGPPEQPPRVGPPPTPKPAREETLLPPEQRRPPVDSTAAMCPFCEAVLPSPAAAQCDKCLRPIPRHGAAPMQPQMPQSPPVLRLQFPSGELQLQPGQHLVLGRDAGQSPVAGTFTQYDNVSRRHTMVWLDQQGTAWVRDERSTNGTFVNDERLPPGADAPLHDGDTLRLAADVTGRVSLG